VDSALNPPESLPTAAKQGRASSNPFIARAQGIPPDQVRIVFNEQMGPSIKNQTNYNIAGYGVPVSAVYSQNGHEVILSIEGAFEAGTYTITVQGVSDIYGAGIDTTRNMVEFTVQEELVAPYLITSNLLENNLLQLDFNVALEQSTAQDTGNYRFDPELRISRAVLSEDQHSVLLTFDSSTPLGPFGKEYIIRIRNIKSTDGIPVVTGIGDAVALVFSTENLDAVHAYPNPVKAGTGPTYVTIAGLPETATVRIFSSTGHLLRTLEEEDGNGGIEWDLKNENGTDVPSGIYIYYIESGSDTRKGKFAVIR
jgi:hypothetical protein